MTEGTQRRLTTIVAADIAGFSRLVGIDEEATLAAQRRHRTELIEPLLAEHHGRIANTAGDSFLLEFPSAVEAVRCAIALQDGIARRNRNIAADRRIEYRIGINVGDVVADGDDLLGDGVNIASRLENLCIAGGIILSDDAYRQVRDRIGIVWEDGGEHEVKNIARPVQVWRWGAAAETDATPSGEAPLALPDKPSIAVLPFDNISGDPEQEHFADGITGDITTALSKIASLFVIARNSAFTYKSKSVDVRQVGRELGVRYLLEGSVRKAGNRLRITGQLVDTESGAHLWADKFDSALQDIFKLQDLVTEAVAGAIEPSVTQAEIKRASLKPTSNLQAYDYLHQAMGRAQLFTYDNLELAMQLARKATGLDPNYAQAHAHIASWYHLKKIYGWMDDEIQETEEGVRLAHLAVQLEPNDPIVLTEAGFAIGHLDVDLGTAIHWFDRAIALNANSALAFGKGAIVRTFAGDYVTAADHADRALRLSPFDVWRFVFSLARGVSHLMRRDLPDAIIWLRKAAQENPRHSSTYLHLASALAYSGEMTEAQGALAHLLELRPKSSVTWQRQRRLFLEDDYEYVLAGARMAGLPE